MRSDSVPQDVAQVPFVYDRVVIDRNRRRLGFLHRHGDAVTAFDICEQPIGVFADERSAAIAVWRRAQRQMQP